MFKTVPTKFFSWVLLAAILAFTVLGMSKAAHAGQTGPAVETISVAHSDSSAPFECPCAPLHDDDDGCCDNCSSCGCHSVVFHLPPALSLKMFTIEASCYDPFRYLPEVYLSKFVPPQNRA